MSHIHELYDFVVVVYIVHDNKVLLVNHPRYQKWLAIGGHIDLDEDPIAALHREVQEESGLSVNILGTAPIINNGDTKPFIAPRYTEIIDVNASHKHISLIYFALAESGQVTLSGEHTGFKWFTSEDLTSNKVMLSPSVTYYCQKALEVTTKK